MTIYEKNPAYIYENVRNHRANLRSSLRPIAHLAMEVERFVCDRATRPPPTIKKVRSKALLCTRMAFPYTFEANVKIERGYNFVLNESRFFDALKASDCTVVRLI